MNNFYASVECMLDPALRKYPVAVCGSVEERHGIVLAKNYAAKAFGIKTGDAVYKWLNRNTAIDEAIYKDCNVEEEIVRSLDIERVRAALKALTPEERDIIMNFYFSENPLSGEALAEKFATTKSSIYRRRDHALRKLKSILGNA